MDKEEKKALIISAALKVFSKSGYTKTSIQDISDFADIGKGTVYQYFRSKEELFKSCFDFYIELMMKEVFQVMEESLDVKEKLSKMFSFTMKSIFDKSDFFSIYLEYMVIESKGSFDSHTVTAFKSIYKDFSGYIVDTINKSGAKLKNGIDAASFASIVGGIIDGVGLQYYVDPGLINQEKLYLSFASIINNLFEDGEDE